MLDLRDAREVLRRLDEALQRLADDAGVPAEVIALVSEIETALADTGPLEIGVSAAVFVRALETSGCVRASLGAADAVTQHRQIVRALRKLRRPFKRASASARARDRAPGARRLLAVFMAWWCSETTKAERTARAVTVVATPAERLLLCHWPAYIGNLLRWTRVWVATDRRLFSPIARAVVGQSSSCAASNTRRSLRCLTNSRATTTRASSFASALSSSISGSKRRRPRRCWRFSAGEPVCPRLPPTPAGATTEAGSSGAGGGSNVVPVARRALTGAVIALSKLTERLY
jgi:hypothetical protein